ncbi:hypothetical protein GCM10010415_01740 [Streptomyces atrovirens]|uniref:Serine/threonine-protein kinase n=1 Tax=Streptomyces atrovirens TaxID=285556 RepID=A0ABW0DY60_9ACTN
MSWDDAPLPRRIGQYRIVGRLGRGGMGEVYIGRTPGGMKVAVKVIHRQHTDDPEFRRRFAREVRAARQVNSAYTAAVVDADPDAEQPWLATIHVAGVSLTQALREYGPWPVSSARALGAGLAEALAAIHAAGVVHRDLKPSNVILTANGPRVIDFGISAVVDATTMTATGTFPGGTAGFASPEQIQGLPVGPPSDVFSLGVLLAHAAGGRSPFAQQTTDRNIVFYRTVHEAPNLDAVPSELRAVVAACLAKDPAGRPGTGELLRWLVEPTDDLETVLGTDAWMPGPVAALAAQRVGESTGALLQDAASSAPVAVEEEKQEAIATHARPDAPADPTASAVPTARADPGAAALATASTVGAAAGPGPGPASPAPGSPPTGGTRASRRKDQPGRRPTALTVTAAVAAVTLGVGGIWWSQLNDSAQQPPSDSAAGPSLSPTPTTAASASSTATASPSSKDSRPASPDAVTGTGDDTGDDAPPEKQPAKEKTTPSVDFRGTSTVCGDFRSTGSPSVKVSACVLPNAAEEYAAFGVQVKNEGAEGATVTAAVWYYDSGEQKTCPNLAEPQRKIYIAPGDTWWSAPGKCGVYSLSTGNFQGAGTAVVDPSGTADPRLSGRVMGRTVTFRDGQALCRQADGTWSPC